MSKRLLYLEGFGTLGKIVFALQYQLFPCNGSQVTCCFDVDEQAREFEIKNTSQFFVHTLPIPDLKTLIGLGIDQVPCVPGIDNPQVFGQGGGMNSFYGRTAALEAKQYIKNARLSTSGALAYDKTGKFGRLIYLAIAGQGGSFGGGAAAESLTGINTLSAEAKFIFLPAIPQAPDPTQREVNLAAQYESWEKLISGLGSKTAPGDIVPIIVENLHGEVPLSGDAFMEYLAELVELFRTTPITDVLARQFIKNTKARLFADTRPRFTAIGWCKVIKGSDVMKDQAKALLMHRLTEEISKLSESNYTFPLLEAKEVVALIVARISDKVDEVLRQRLPKRPQGLLTFSVLDAMAEILESIGVDELIENSLHSELEKLFGQSVYTILITKGLEAARTYATRLQEWTDQVRQSLVDLSPFVDESRRELNGKLEKLLKVQTWLPWGKSRQARKFTSWLEAAKDYGALYTTSYIHEKLRQKFVDHSWADELVRDLRDWNPEARTTGQKRDGLPGRAGHVRLAETPSAKRMVEREVERVYPSFKEELLCRLKTEKFYVSRLLNELELHSETYGLSIANSIQVDSIWDQMQHGEQEDLINRAIALSSPKVRLEGDPSLLRGSYVFVPDNREFRPVAEAVYDYVGKSRPSADLSKGQHDDDPEALVVFQCVAFPLDVWRSFSEWHALLDECDTRDDMRWRIAYPTPVAAFTPRPQELMEDEERWLQPLSGKLEPELVNEIRQQLTHQHDVRGYYEVLYSWFIDKGADFQDLLPEDVQAKLRSRWMNVRGAKR